MSAYTDAFDKYHADGVPEWSWTEAMEFHLQFGAVVSLPGAFIMARRVWRFDPPEVQLCLSPLHSPAVADCWHVWAAAGSLEALGWIAGENPAPFVSFLRRADLRLRVYPLHRLLRHELESAQAKSPAPCPATGDAGRP